MLNAIVSAALVGMLSIGAFLMSFSDLSDRVENLENWKPTVIESLLIKGEDKVGGDTQIFLGGFPYTIAGSGITATAQSITVTSFTLPQNGYLIQDSDLSDTFYVTLEPGNTARQEFVSCTTVTQNGSGSATFSGCTRGLSPVTPYTASTTLRFSHAGGTKLIFSNPPQLYDQAAFKGNDESITGIWNFSSTSVPRYDLVPTNHNTGAIVSTTSEFASIRYVNVVATAGCADADQGQQGCVELATGAEAAAGTVSGSDARLVLQASSSTSTPGVLCGFCVAVTRSTGKLAQAFLDLTEHFIFDSLFATAASSTRATTTNQYIATRLAVATTGPSTLSVVSVTGDGYFTGGLGIGAATTTDGDLRVTGHATTSSLTVSLSCTNCVSGWERVTNTGAGPTTGSAFATASVDCSAGKKVIGGGASNNEAGKAYVVSSYPADSNTWTVVFQADAAGSAANTMTVYAICTDAVQ